MTAYTITYTIYKCNTCSRIKNVPESDKYAFLNYCTITKGCAGRLFAIGESSTPSVAEHIPGIVDWYPRNVTPVIQEEVKQEKSINLSCSNTNSLVIALRLTTAEKDIIGNNIDLVFEQRKISDISFTQYSFKSANGQTIFTGKDRNNSNMRFDQTAIDNNRIFVKANGVSRFVGSEADEIQLTPDTVTFNSSPGINSVISVTVYKEPLTMWRALPFQLNAATAGIDNTAWTNIRHFDDADADFNNDGRKRWWLFTCNGNNLISFPNGANLRFVKIEQAEQENIALDFSSDCRFLFAKNPFAAKDRHLNLFATFQFLHKDFVLQCIKENSKVHLTIPSSGIEECFPPFLLNFSPTPNSSIAGSSYLDADNEVVLSSTDAIISDKDQEVLAISTIIGPI